MSTKVLLFTLSELGQANPMLAIFSELISRPHTEVHFATFPVLEKRVERLSVAKNPCSSAVFHPLSGKPYGELEFTSGLTIFDAIHPPLSLSLEALPRMMKWMAPWGDDEYLAQMNEVKELILEVDPDIILVDMLFEPAHDACKQVKRHYIVNSPVQMHDLVAMKQPHLRWLWYYPARFSAYTFPLSWISTFWTIYITIRMILVALTSQRFKDVMKFRKKQRLEGPPFWMENYRENLDYICPSIPETEWPVFFAPDNIKRCGPIINDSLSVDKADSELASWLDNAQTVFVCLGSHILATEREVREILGGLLSGLPSNTQVLWKLLEAEKWEGLIDDIFKQHGITEKDRGRFRITNWIVPDPGAVLQHPNVKCSVHHGGASSFFEACYAGIPHVILGKWYDLYDNASRAEYQGFGVFGNRSVAPNVDATEFAKALNRVMGDDQESIKIHQRAAEVGELCRQAGGKKTAVDFIFEVTAKNRA